MTDAKAHRIVIASSAVTFMAVFSHKLLADKEFPKMRFFTGSAILFVAMGAIADLNAELAAPFAVLIATTALLAEGGEAMSLIIGEQNGPVVKSLGRQLNLKTRQKG